MEQEGEGGGSGQYAKELSEDDQRRQRELLAERVAAADCVITTAAVPGRPAPKLITAEMVQRDAPGIGDRRHRRRDRRQLRADRAGAVVVRNGVTIDGTLNLPSQMPFHASLLYANNVANLLLHLATEGESSLDFEDEIIAGAASRTTGRSSTSACGKRSRAR